MAFYSYLSTKIIIAFITKSYQDLFGVRSYINAIIKLNENPRYWHIMYDKYRNVYYRFAEMPYKLASNESPYDEPKGKEFSVIVLNADFEIIGETKFPGKKYFYKKSFVGREGLYISENNLENPQFDENKLVFTCFKIKNASPNK